MIRVPPRDHRGDGEEPRRMAGWETAGGVQGIGIGLKPGAFEIASRRHIEDLRAILPELGFDYRIPGPAGHWQALCPACKRCTVANAQLRTKDAARAAEQQLPSPSVGRDGVGGR